MRIISIFLFLCLAILGCNQEPDEVERKVPENSLECKDTNFEGNFLEHSNLVNLFSCLGWDEKFPDLDKSFKNIKPGSWNHLVLPINKEYFENIDRRNRFFGAINKLDKSVLDGKTGLDNLSIIFSSMMDSNFYDALYNLFEEARQSSANSSLKQERISQQEIMGLFDLLNMPADKIKDSLFFVNSLNKSYKNPNADISTFLRENLKKPLFIQSRKDLISAYMNMFLGEGPTEMDKVVIPSFPSLGSVLGSEPFIYKLFHQDDFSYYRFFDILNFSTWYYPNMVNDQKLLRAYMLEGGICKVEGPSDIFLSVDEEFRTFVDQVTSKSHFNFFKFTTDRKIRMILAENNCGWGEVDVDGQTLDVFNVFNSVTTLFTESSIFNVIQFLHSLSMGFDDDSGLEDDPYYFSDFTIGRFSKPLNDFSKAILPKVQFIGDYEGDDSDPRDNSLLKPLYHLIKGLGPDAFLSLASILDYFFEENQLNILKTSAKVWNYFGEQPNNVQDFLLNILDIHFQEGIQYRSLFEFYEYLDRDFPVVIPTLAKQYAADEEQREKTFNAILDISKNLKGEAVLKDLRSFYSRDYILAIIGLIASNVENPPDLGEPIKSPVFDEIKARLNRNKKKLYIFKSDFKSQTLASKEMVACINKLSGQDFYYFIENFPKECEGLSTGEFSVDLLNYLSVVEEDYRDYTKKSFVLFDKNGLASPEMNRFIMKMALIARDEIRLNDENIASTKVNGLEPLVETIKHHLFELKRLNGSSPGEKGYLKELNGIIKLLNDILKNEVAGQEDIENFIFSELGKVSDKKIKSFMADLGTILEDYSQFEPKKRDYNYNSNCADLSSAYGVNPCPLKKEIKDTVKKLLKIMSRKNNGEERTLLRMFFEGADYRVGAQLRGRKKPFVMSLRKWLDFLWIQGSRDPQYIRKFKYIYTYDDPGNDSFSNDEVELEGNIGDMFELLIRDIQINNNQLAAFWQNDQADTKNHKFKKKLKTNFKLFKFCVKLRLCGQYLNSYAHAKAKNVVNVYPAAISLADDFDLKPFPEKFNFKDHLHFIVNAAYQSSGKKSKSKNWLIMMNNKELNAHNGQFFGKLSNISGIRNFSRWVHDRFGSDTQSYYDNVMSYEFRRLNQRLFSGMSSTETAQILENFIQNHTGVKTNFLNELVDHSVDWISGLTDNELGELETFAANLLVISTYLGAGDIEYMSAYGTITGKRVLSQLDNLITLYPTLSKEWKGKINSIIPVANNILEFFRMGLRPESKNRSAYFRLLNDSFLILERALFYKVATSQQKVVFGLDMVIAAAKKKVNEINDRVLDIYDYFSRLHIRLSNGKRVEDKTRFLKTGENLGRVAKNPHFSTLELRNYWLLTTNKEIEGKGNPHYREFPRLVDYLSSNISGTIDKTRFTVLAETLFTDHGKGKYSSMKQFLLDVFDYKKLVLIKDRPQIFPDELNLINPPIF